MSNLPIKANDSTLKLPGIYSPTGLELPEKLPFDEWSEVGLKLSKIERTVLWWIGDWLNYGERKYGEKYSQALDETGFDYQTLADSKWISSKVKVSCRQENLTFEHHRHIAKFESDEQREWLDRAAMLGWSAKELRQQIKQRGLLDYVRHKQAIEGTGEVSIVESDAIAFLGGLNQRYDLLITDPPYSTDIADIEAFCQEWVPLALSRIKDTGRAYVFTGPYPDELSAYISIFKQFCQQSGWTLDTPLVWTYRNAIGPDTKHKYKLNWQTCFHLFGPEAPPLNERELLKKFSVQEMNAPDARNGVRLHAWQKPDEIAERLISQSTIAGQTILDPFCGTGTFIAAASRLGCSAHGCDVNPQMLDLCRQRGLPVVERADAA